MGTILIICTVCAEFRSPVGETFKILPHERGVIKEAPAWIQETLMFSLLKKDNSISYVNRTNIKQAENDPFEGIAADGKAEEKAEEKPKKRTTKKG